MKSGILGLVLATALVACSKTQKLSLVTTQTDAPLSRHERLLTTIPDNVTRWRRISCIQGERVAYIAQKEGKEFFVLDGVPSAGFDRVFTYNFSPNYQHTAFVASNSKSETQEEYHVVVDGVVSEAYDFADFEMWGALFSADSKHVVYGASIGSDELQVFDGRTTKLQRNEESFPLIFDSVSKRTWAFCVTNMLACLCAVDQAPGSVPRGARVSAISPDMKRFAFVTKDKDRFRVIVDGKESEAFDRIASRGVIFSPDSKRFAFYAEQNGHCFVVVDGKKSKPFDLCGDTMSLSFSPDSQHVVHNAIRNKKWLAVINGEESEAFDQVSPPNFSPDSTHLAFSAAQNGKYFVVINGKKGQQFQSHEKFGFAIKSDVIFSPNGEHYAYIVEEREENTRGWRQRVVIDDRDSTQTGGMACWPRFSPDSTKFAYAVWTGNKNYWVISGTKQEEFDHIREGMFTPDSRHFIYVAETKRKYSLVIDGKAHEEFDEIQGPYLSPDGTWLAYGAVKGREIWWKVIEFAK